MEQLMSYLVVIIGLLFLILCIIMEGTIHRRNKHIYHESPEQKELIGTLKEIIDEQKKIIDDLKHELEELKKT